MKTYLKKFDIEIDNNESINVVEKLSSEFEQIAGVFAVEKQVVTPAEVPAPEIATMKNITFGMKVSGLEVIPNNTDLSLIELNGKYPWRDAMCDLRIEALSAKNATVEFAFSNSFNQQNDRFCFSIYLLLINS